MQCPNCGYEPTMAEMQRSPDDCVKCGINYQGFARSLERRAEEDRERRAKLAAMAPAVKEAAQAYAGAQPVVVVDIKMGFWSMVIFMVKWAIAAIPALTILALIFSVFFTLASAVPAYFRYMELANTMKDAIVEPERIPVLVPTDDDFYSVGKAVRSSIAAITVKTVSRSGDVTFSRLVVDCAKFSGYISASGATLSALNAAQVERSYEAIKPGTPRQYIAKYACVGADRVHALLQ